MNGFKEFILKGNIVDMAVGVIIGAAFGKIVSSLVDDILMPLLGMLIGGIDFTALQVKIGTATVNYGLFIQNVVDFLIIGFTIYIMLRIAVKMSQALHKKEEAVTEEAPVAPTETELLTEIRDLMKRQN